MRILVDTNIVLDILLKREEFLQDSYNALNTAVQKGDILFLSSSAVTDIYYLVRKQTLSSDFALNCIRKLCTLFTFADVNESSILNALNSNIKDFEDAVVDSVGQQLDADLILTRNIKDFAGAKTIIKNPVCYLEERF